MDLTLEGETSRINFDQEKRRIDTDFKQNRRNTAEGLLGRGSAVYSGRHFRDQTEASARNAANVQHLDDSYTANIQDRSNQLTNLAAQLGEDGTAISQERAENASRYQANLQASNESGEPDYSLSPAQRVNNLNKRIKAMRTRAEKIKDPKKRSAYRKKIQKVRKERDRVGKL
jgi:hypothetical protein